MPRRYASPTRSGAFGPSLTSLPSLATTTAIGFPSELEMRLEISEGLVTGRPPIETSRSPCSRPICAAGESSCTAEISDVALPALVMNRIDMSTIARTMFAPGPAKIATSRLQVAAFQYASGPSASFSSVRPFSADASASGEIFCLPSASSNSSIAGTASCGSVAPSPRRIRSNGPASEGASETARDRRRSASCGIGRCIPGMVTNPRSGSLRPRTRCCSGVRFTIAGGNPT